VASDIALICAQLCEMEVAPDLAEEIRRVCGGRMRLVMNAIARVERYGRGNRKVSLADMKGRPLLANDDRPALEAA
jgi:xanthine/CO dehydrogenase XdhC/CoxF family maturation factor